MCRCDLHMNNAGHLKFNWKRYLSLAEYLLESMEENEDDESKDRCGISRAYYAAFHRAGKFLRAINQTVDIYQSGSHENIIKVFEDFGRKNKPYAFIAKELKRLKLMRIKADYNDKYFENARNTASLKQELKKAILMAKDIIDTIDEIEQQEKD